MKVKSSPTRFFSVFAMRLLMIVVGLFIIQIHISAAQVKDSTNLKSAKKGTTSVLFPGISKTDSAVAGSTVSQSKTPATGVKNSKKSNQPVLKDVPNIRKFFSWYKIFWTLVVLLITYLMNRFLGNILENLSEKASTYRLFVKRLIPVVRLTIWILALYFVIAGIINPPLETIITVTASVGIAIGFASQDILKNIFGGFMIISGSPVPGWRQN